MAVKYPRVRFLNCSVDTPYSSFRTYYCRIYEAKFITGAIAGAMANNDKIGYIASSPIFGVPASINAFALGARLTNPRAKIYLRWSCLPGNPQEDFLKEGMQVITNREVSTPEKRRMNFFSYGTYAMSPTGELSPLASPCWLWGNFYEKIIRSVLNGSWDKEQDTPRALNYWWGFDSDAIDVKLAPTLPEGCHALADILREGLRSGTIDPFLRKIVTQDGTLINDGTRTLTPDEILRMDWLCDNVIGSIPEFDELEPFAQPMTRQLGIYRDRIPAEKEGTL
jgi:basic membrane lipoprotein Med (substrate-binding protein (PBP1-ABC) superfamily)